MADLADEWLTHPEQNEGTKEESTILRLRPRVECRDYKQMLGEMLEWAVSRRYLTWNPARLAELPKDRSSNGSRDGSPDIRERPTPRSGLLSESL